MLIESWASSPAVYSLVHENLSCGRVGYTFIALFSVREWRDHLTLQRHCYFIFVAITVKIIICWMIDSQKQKIIGMSALKPPRPADMSVDAVGESSDSAETLVFHVCCNYCKNDNLVNYWLIHRKEKSSEWVCWNLRYPQTCPLMERRDHLTLRRHWYFIVVAITAKMIIWWIIG